MFMFGWDPTFILLLPAMFFAMWAQWKVQRTYSEMSKVRAANGMTGAQMAADIMRRNGVTDVAVEEVGGTLSDHYDPRSKTVRLSSGIARGDSVASIAVAAHEVGHVLQHAQGYPALALRSGIAPVASICSGALSIASTVSVLSAVAPPPLGQRRSQDHFLPRASRRPAASSRFR